MKKESTINQPIVSGFYLINLAIGLIWLNSVYGKILSGKFAGTLGVTLGKFASENPYPPVKTFLENIAIPNSKIFASLTMTGELFAAATLIIASVVIFQGKKHVLPAKIILLLGLSTGAFLNITFFLSAGWMSPSTWSLNALMAAQQIIGALLIAKNIKLERMRSV